MKRTAAVVFLMLACAACAGTMDWRYGKPGRVVVTNEEDAAALSAISALSTQGLARVRDTAQPSRYFMEIANSTGTVFEVTGPFTNLMVTLSDDFEETVTHTRPAWTNNVFPFTDGLWAGEIYTEGGIALYCGEPVANWYSASRAIPATLSPLGDSSQGTATVSVASIYYTTNAIKHLATEAELEAAKAACGVVLTNTVDGAVSNLTADIASATNALMPYARTVYGDLAATNEAGYAAFNATNAAESSYSTLIPSSSVGTFTNYFRYRFNSLRKFGVLTNTAWFVKGGFGSGYKSVSTVVSVNDIAGNTLASSASQPADLWYAISACVTNTLSLPSNVYSGTVDVACIAVSTNASLSVRLYSGAQYTNLLTFSESPTEYATHTELSSLRAELPAIVLSNSVPQTIVRSVSVSSTNILVSSTNSAYYVALDNAANIGFDFSALALGGTKRADITAVIDCLNTQALYSAINTNAVAMDFPWEPTVTGRYELAVSSDGVRTTASQAWPNTESPMFAYSKYNYAGTPATMPDLVVIADGSTNGAAYTWVACPDCWYAVRAQFGGGNEGDTVTFGYYRGAYGFGDYISSYVVRTATNPGTPYGFSSGWVIIPPPYVAMHQGAGIVNVAGLWVTRSSSTSALFCRSIEVRKANALEIKATQALGY